MGEIHHEVRFDDLVAHREWVRELARRLVRDEARADDVLQEVYAESLRRPPASARSLRGWLAAVTRNAARKMARSERRRAHHESRADAPRTVEPTADVVARAELHRSVVAAVVALAEPERTAVLLRYYEGLTLRETAARMRAPFETTRKRIARGRERVRRRLESGESGERRSLAVLLAPLLARPRAGWIPGGVLMTITKTKLATAVGVALLLVAAGLTLGPDGDAAPEDGPRAALPAPGPGPGVEDAGPGEEADAGRDEDTGVDVGMLLDGNYPPSEFEDVPLDEGLGEIAAKTGIPIYLTASAAREIEEQRIRIGLRSLNCPIPIRSLLDILKMRGVIWEERPDRVVFRLASGRPDPNEESVLVPGWKPDPDAPRRLVVRGRVVDEAGEVVPGAELFALARGSPDALGRATDRGGFEFAVSRPYPRMAARAPGRVTSLAVPVQGEPGETIRIDVALRGPAARIEGTVRDEAGNPIAGALVTAGGDRNPHWDAPNPIEPPPIPVRTDDGGRYVLSSVGPGTRGVRAGLRGHRPAWREVAIDAGATATVDLVLPAGTVVTGVVKDDRGEPVAGAVVTAMRPGGETFGFTKTDDDGRYRLSGLPDFPLAVVVEGPSGVRASERFASEDGPDLSFDAVLERGRAIRGRVVDAEGLPLPGWRVKTLVGRLHGPRGFSEDRISEFVTTDEDGRFVLGALSEGPYRIGTCPTTQRIPLVVADVAGAGEQVLRVPGGRRPSCAVSVRVLGPDESPLSNAKVSLIDAESGEDVGQSPDDEGRVDLPLLPAGEYEVVLRSWGPDNPRGFLRLGRRALEPGVRLDLGAVRFPEPGRIRVVRPDGEDRTWRSVEVRELLADGTTEGVWGAHPRPGETKEQLVVPGRYAVRLFGPNQVLRERRIDLRSGAEETFTVELEPAPVRTLRLSLPKDVAPLAALVEVLDSEGRPAFLGLTKREPRDAPLADLKAPLLPGTYRVRIHPRTDRTLETSLEIPDDAREEARFDITPR